MSNITKCPISGTEGRYKYLDLGEIPLVNNLCKTKDDSLSCDRFPLVVQSFHESNLSCLTTAVPKEELFSSYVYKSGVNIPYLSHCSDMFDYIDRYVNTENGGIVLDIGGNDGSLLKEFKKKNKLITPVNVDPCNAFRNDNEDNGITYFDMFFNESVKMDEPALIITSTNVFQHNRDIRSFVRGVYNNLSDEGVWCLEFPYLLSTIITNNFDQIYHEHIYYYLLTNIHDLVEQEGMKVVNASYYPIHSGTMRVIITKKTNRFIPDSSVDTFLYVEKELSSSFYNRWGAGIKDNIENAECFIKNLVNVCGKTIYGFGAAAKGCVFLNTTHLTNEVIPIVMDDTKEKQGLFIPGTGIEIHSRDILRHGYPDYILILAHNFKHYIMDSLRADGYEGKFLTMFPDVRVY